LHFPPLRPPPVAVSVRIANTERKFQILLKDGSLAEATLTADLVIAATTGANPHIHLSPAGTSLTIDDGPLVLEDNILPRLTQRVGGSYPSTEQDYVQPYKYSPQATVSGIAVSPTPIEHVHVSQTLIPEPKTSLSAHTGVKLGNGSASLDYTISLSAERVPKPRFPLPTLNDKTAPFLVAAVEAVLLAAAASAGRPRTS
jgi:hypothetical protein